MIPGLHEDIFNILAPKNDEKTKLGFAQLSLFLSEIHNTSQQTYVLITN